MDVGNWCPSAGWVAGVVGVHPWELAFNDRRLQEEVWGDDPDTWVASPYAPERNRDADRRRVRAQRPMEVLVGHRPVRLDRARRQGHRRGRRADRHAARDAASRPTTRSSTTRGTSSVSRGPGARTSSSATPSSPTYRTLDVATVLTGQAAVDSGRTQPLYRLPWTVMFPCAVSAALVGIAEGVLRHGIEYQKSRVSALGVAQVVGLLLPRHHRRGRGRHPQCAHAADLQHRRDVRGARRRARRSALQQRVACRRDQVRAAWRAAKAADDVYAVCGGNSIRRDTPRPAVLAGHARRAAPRDLRRRWRSTTAPPACSWASRRRAPRR